jgi:hypothetical protein
VPFQTVADLLEDALFLAGKETDEGSEFFERGLAYLNAAQDALVGGGPLGGAVLEIVDWLWAIKQPRGFLVLEPRFDSGAITVALVTDQASGTLSADPGISLVGYRLVVSGETHHPLVSTHEGTGLTFTSPWVAADTTTAFTAEKREYDLASDFHRVASPLRCSDRSRIDVVSSVDEGVPCDTIQAALIAPRKVKMSGVLARRSVYEYDYIFEPARLTIGGPDPVCPLLHRRVLSYGAAYAILYDCRDDTAAGIYQMFATEWDAMERDQKRNYRAGSALHGQFIPELRQSPNVFTGWR